MPKGAETLILLDEQLIANASLQISRRTAAKPHHNVETLHDGKNESSLSAAVCILLGRLNMHCNQSNIRDNTNRVGRRCSLEALLNQNAPRLSQFTSRSCFKFIRAQKPTR